MKTQKTITVTGASFAVVFLLTGFAYATTYEMSYYADGQDHFYSPPIYLTSGGTHTFFVNGVPWGSYNYVAYEDSGGGYSEIWSDSTSTGWDPSFSTYVNVGYKVKLVIYDGSWNVKSVYYWYIYGDTTPPTTPGTPDLSSSDDTGRYNYDNITNKTSGLTFSWSASSDSGTGLAGYEWKLDSGSWNSISSTSTNISASNGSHTFYVRAKDNAGNYSSSRSLSFTVDNVSPNVPSIIYPSVNQHITDTTPAFDWSGSDNSGGSGIWRYHILVETDTLGMNKIDEYPTSSNYNTPSSQALDAGGAGYDWELWAYDIAGNVSSGTGEKRFYIDDPVDTTPPTTPGTPDMASGDDTGYSNTDNITKDTSIQFTWSASSDSGSGLKGYWWALDDSTPESGGNWITSNSCTVSSPPEGTRTLYVKAEDNQGNRSSASQLTFVADRTAPNPPNLISPANDADIYDTTPTFDWSTVSGVYSYTLRYETSDIGDEIQVTVQTSAHTPSVALQYAKTYYWDVYSTDVAGNSSGWSTQWTFTIWYGNQEPGPEYGNTTAQEYGDAIYNRLGVSGIPEYNHAGLVSGIDTSGNQRTFESTSGNIPDDPDNDPDNGPQEGTLAAFKTPSNEYYGGFNSSGYSTTMPFATRRSIVGVGKTVVDADIYYPSFIGIPWPVEALEPKDPWTAPIDASEIHALRCDGFVEYVYEVSGVRVWRNCLEPDGEWNIAYYPSHHGGLDLAFHHSEFEMSPWAQRGATKSSITGPGYSGPPWPDTTMTKPSVVNLPTVQFTQLAITPTYADIEIRATDESGIFKIIHSDPSGSGPDVTQKNPLRHPDADNYTVQVRVMGQPGATTNFFAKAQDHGGNLGDWHYTPITFPNIYYDLTTQVQGEGSVALDPTGGTYASGSTVEVQANASSVWHFARWEGDLSGSTNPTTIVMDDNKNITAVFEENLATYSLTVNIQGQGSVSLNPPGGSYNSGTVVQLAAIPNFIEWQFVQWGGDLSGSTNPTSIMMNENKTITAYFDLPSCDFNSDTLVNLADYALLAAHWSRTDCGIINDWCNGTDIDYSGSVNINDFLIFAEDWLEINTIPIDDFESGNLSSWSFGGDTHWVIVSDKKNTGLYSAASGIIIDDQMTYMYTTQDVPRGYISFARKVSSEYGYDWFVFYVDGEPVDIAGGESDWKEKRYFTNAGTYAFCWAYQKDSSVSEGSDSAWVDDIVFYPQSADSDVCSWAELRAYKILGEDIVIVPGDQCSYVPVYETWIIGASNGGFTGTFNCPSSGQYELRVTHQTSASASCPGGGYAPVTISVNGSPIVSNYDPAENHGGTHGSVTDSWIINANAGSNTFEWKANNLCTNYWIQKIEIVIIEEF